MYKSIKKSYDKEPCKKVRTFSESQSIDDADHFEVVGRHLSKTIWNLTGMSEPKSFKERNAIILSNARAWSSPPGDVCDPTFRLEIVQKD